MLARLSERLGEDVTGQSSGTEVKVWGGTGSVPGQAVAQGTEQRESCNSRKSGGKAQWAGPASQALCCPLGYSIFCLLSNSTET